MKTTQDSRKELVDALRAGFSLFYIPTEEMTRTCEIIEEAINSFTNKAGNSPYKVAFWDLEKNQDPDVVVELLSDRGLEAGTVVVAKNWNWFLMDSIEGPNKRYVTAIQNRLEEMSSAELRRALVIVSDSSFDRAIPPTLQQEFMKVSFELPGEKEVEEIYEEIIESAQSMDGFQQPSEDSRQAIIENARGLTRQNVSNAISMGFIAGDGLIDPKVVGSFRAKKIEDVAGLKLGRYKTEKILGYEEVKKFCLGSIDNDLALGVLLIGPPGTGKTHFGRWLASQSNKIMVEMEMAQMQGEGLYGQAEQAWGKAIGTLKALGRHILFIDEIEKGLPSGNNQFGSQDKTAERSAGQFLKFLSDERPKGCYVIATCNSLNVPPEWVRPGRWDCAPFYVGLPTEEDREAIYEHYVALYGVEMGGFGSVDMEGWSGAEIQSVCRLAKLHNVTCAEARRWIIPVSKTMENEIKRLEEWAKVRTIPASTPFESIKKARRVRRAVEL